MNERKKLIDSMLAPDMRKSTIETALEVLRHAMAPEAEDLAAIVSTISVDIARALTFKAGFLTGFDKLEYVMVETAKCSAFIAYASMPTTILSMQKAKPESSPMPNFVSENLLAFSRDVQSGKIKVPDMSNDSGRPLRLYIMPNGWLALHPEDCPITPDKKHWPDMSAAVPFSLKEKVDA